MGNTDSQAFGALLDRKNRFLSPLKDKVAFESLTAVEELGGVHRYNVGVVSRQPELTPAEILGKAVSVEVEWVSTKIPIKEAAPAKLRRFSGYVTNFKYVGVREQYYRYEVVIEPWLALLGYNLDYRVFQQKNVPDILREVLEKHSKLGKFEMNLRNKPYRVWSYCVQYAESDLDFVGRLMQQEGIYYFYKHDEKGATLVLVDEPSCHDKIAGCEEISLATAEQSRHEYLQSWDVYRQVQPGKFSYTSFDFKNPRADLSAKRTEEEKHDLASAEIYHYPHNYFAQGDGEKYLRGILEAVHSRYETVHAAGFVRNLTTGGLFQVKNHPLATFDKKDFLVVRSTLSVSEVPYETGENSYSSACSCELLDAKRPFRPAKTIPRPTIPGIQTATVVGPAGDEIHTDKYGRIRVQFHWDRYGKKNETSSCWVRVASPWAGAKFGGIHIPRIGQEVVVGFLDGDPDKPLVIGSVYNTDQMPPWDLPGNATQSGFLTRSSKGGAYDNANAIRFEDKKGAEQLWVHAEKNQDNEVENDETTSVGHDRTETVGNNETITIGVDRSEKVGSNETIAIGVNRTETVGANESVTVGANRSVKVGASETKTVALQRTHMVGVNETIGVGGAQEVGIGGFQAIVVGAYQTTNVGGYQTNNIGANQTTSVGGAQSNTIGAAQSTKVGAARSINVGAAQTVDVSANASMSVGGDEARSVKGGRSTSVGKDDALKVTNNMVIDAGDSVTIKTGSASITMKKDGTITIKGKDITIDGSGKIKVNASSDVVVKGSKIGLN